MPQHSDHPFGIVRKRGPLDNASGMQSPAQCFHFACCLKQLNQAYIYLLDHWRILRVVPAATFASMQVDWWCQAGTQSSEMLGSLLLSPTYMALQSQQSADVTYICCSTEGAAWALEGNVSTQLRVACGLPRLQGQLPERWVLRLGSLKLKLNQLEL